MHFLEGVRFYPSQNKGFSCHTIELQGLSFWGMRDLLAIKLLIPQSGKIPSNEISIPLNKNFHFIVQ